MFSTSRPAAQEPLPQASTSDAPQTSRRERCRPIHTRKPSISQSSTSSSYRSNDTPRSKVWDQDDTFFPRAKPPPPLPKLDKHRRTKSQYHVPSQPRLSLSSDRSLPVLDISRRYFANGAQSPLTASSGTSDESPSKLPWQPPPSWAGPPACTEDELKTPKPARSRFGSRRRAPSNTRADAVPEKPKSPEPEVVRVEIVGPGEEVDLGRVGRCPSTGVLIQYYEGWDEKPVEDIVHVLRELKLR